MRRRHPRDLPRLWLMTDERQGDALWIALAALPRGAGVVFRHRTLPRQARKALFERVRRIADRRRLVLVLAGSPRDAAAWGAAGFHANSCTGARRSQLWIAAAHDRVELIAAERVGADLVLVSPVHPTRSHPGAPALGRVRFGLLARRARAPVIALGGMTPRRAKALEGFGIYGWAAIDGLTPARDQNLKAVPT